MPQGIVIPEVDPTTITVPAAGFVALCADLSGRLNVVKPDGSINPINPIAQMSDEIQNSASAGAINVGPGAGCHTVVVNVSGLATVRQICLIKVGLTALDAGKRIKVVFLFPGSVQGIGLQIFDANTSGALLFNYTTDGIQGSAVADLHFDGAQWQIDDAKVPATL